MGLFRRVKKIYVGRERIPEADKPAISMGKNALTEKKIKRLISRSEARKEVRRRRFNMPFHGSSFSGPRSFNDLDNYDPIWGK